MIGVVNMYNDLSELQRDPHKDSYVYYKQLIHKNLNTLTKDTSTKHQELIHIANIFTEII